MLEILREKYRSTRLKISYVLGYLMLNINDVEYGRRIRIAGNIYIRNLGTIKLGNNVKINAAHWSNTVGSGTKTCFDVWEGGILSIGDNSGISNCEISALKRVDIGNDVLIGGVQNI